MKWWPKKNVLVPIDFSEESFAAIDTALELVDKPSHVRVLHVLEELHAYELGEYYGAVSNESRGQNVLREFRERLSDVKYKELT